MLHNPDFGVLRNRNLLAMVCQHCGRCHGELYTYDDPQLHAVPMVMAYREGNRLMREARITGRTLHTTFGDFYAFTLPGETGLFWALAHDDGDRTGLQRPRLRELVTMRR